MDTSVMSGEKWSESSMFCDECGSILPPLLLSGGVECYSCKKIYSSDIYKGFKRLITVDFNMYSEESHKTTVDGGDAKGPVVERKCPACGNEEMSYATLQLRSADEGQTVFYTCTKCSYKESENS